MRIALLSDIHANLPALEAVIAHGEGKEIDKIWNLGDSVGYGAFPDEVVQLLRQESILSILGDYDRKALKANKKGKKSIKTKHPQKRLAFIWANRHLSARSRKYLRSLPEKRQIKESGWDMLLIHGSPASRKEHLEPDTPESRLKELSKIASAQIVICGHSHQPFLRHVDQVRFINPGSVGRPDDGDPRASYAILELRQEWMWVDHYRVDYDVVSAVQAIRKNNLPEEFAQMLIQGCSLDAIHAQDKT